MRIMILLILVKKNKKRKNYLMRIKNIINFLTVFYLKKDNYFLIIFLNIIINLFLKLFFFHHESKRQEIPRCISKIQLINIFHNRKIMIITISNPVKKNVIKS